MSKADPIYNKQVLFNTPYDVIRGFIYVFQKDEVTPFENLIPPAYRDHFVGYVCGGIDYIRPPPLQ